MSAFLPLLSLTCRHEFFAGAPCPAVKFVPTPACDRHIFNAGLVLRQGGGRLSVHYDPERAAAMAGDVPFDFFIYASDPEFVAYTEALPQAAGKVLHFEARPSEDGREVRLGHGDQVSAADLLPVDQVPADCLVHPAVPPVCSVRIHAAGAGPGGQDYSLRFRARRTTWLYYVSGKGLAASDLYVTGSGGEQDDFDGGRELTLPDGLRACLFRSKSPLPLLRDQPRRYALRARSSGRAVLKDLPVPAPRGLGREMQDGQDGQDGAGGLTSPMFVNL